MIQKEYEIVVDETTQKCKEYFNHRLYATYLTGSISVCEAINGESDLDYWIFIVDDLNDDDKTWLKCRIGG